METVDPKSHWEKVYRTKHPTEVSWYLPHLDVSLRFIEEAARNRDARVIDVGGGESTLVDDLLARGYRNLSVLDVSSPHWLWPKNALVTTGTRSTGFAVT